MSLLPSKQSSVNALPHFIIIQARERHKNIFKGWPFNYEVASKLSFGVFLQSKVSAISSFHKRLPQKFEGYPTVVITKKDENNFEQIMQEFLCVCMCVELYDSFFRSS